MTFGISSNARDRFVAIFQFEPSADDLAVYCNPDLTRGGVLAGHYRRWHAQRARLVPGWEARATPPAREPSRYPEESVTACRHRGEQLRTDRCDLCGLRGQPFDVFACGLHGECSLTRRHSKIRSCAACPDAE